MATHNQITLLLVRKLEIDFWLPDYITSPVNQFLAPISSKYILSISLALFSVREIALKILNISLFFYLKKMFTTAHVLRQEIKVELWLFENRITITWRQFWVV